MHTCSNNLRTKKERDYYYCLWQVAFVCLLAQMHLMNNEGNVYEWLYVYLAEFALVLQFFGEAKMRK